MTNVLTGEPSGTSAADLRAYWVWLQNGVGIAGRAGEILACFSNPKELYEAGPREWRLSGALTGRQIQRLESYSPEQAQIVVKQCDTNGWKIVTPVSPDYPSLLLQTENYPVVLYTWGDLGCLKNTIPVAVVGTRSATRRSVDITGRLCASLAAAGAVVVSGGALGIDSAAHTGALFGGGKTVAVLGCGLDAKYLMGNFALRTQIAASGAVVSEYPPQTSAAGPNFPIRNRLISGMCLGTVVIEAGERSGSLITASFALEQGRDVFAVAGDIINSSFTGTNKLIRDGAKPVFSAADILEEYAFRCPGLIDTDNLERDLSKVASPAEGLAAVKTTARRERPAPVSDAAAVTKGSKSETRAARPLPEGTGEDAKRIYALIGTQPAHINDIVAASGLDSAAVFTAVTELELFGYIELAAGRRYVLKQ